MVRVFSFFSHEAIRGSALECEFYTKLLPNFFLFIMYQPYKYDFFSRPLAAIKCTKLSLK